MSFKKDFLWGAASASAQVEGGYLDDGKSLTIWDVTSKKRVKHGDNCHVGCDHYHHYKEDVALMKQMGLKSYRFSLSWARIMPENGKINQKGIDFYNNLINELLTNDIEPLITIFHWDLPLWAYKKGGWLSRKIVKLFADYTQVVVDAFSDRVQYWMPMNEPQCFIMNGYMQGAHAPFKHRYLALPRLTKNCMLAFSESVKIIRKSAKKTPKIGIAMAAGAFVPDDDNSSEQVEDARKKTFYSGAGLMSNRWWCDPMLLGKGVSAFGIYRISDKFAQKIYQSLDFLGLNLYSPYNDADWGGDGKKQPAGKPRNSMGWSVDAKVLYYAPKFMYERYNLPIMITEDGLSENDWICLDGKVHDAQRCDFLHRYLKELSKVADEIPVIGYQYWSVMDNFEWAEGYDPRFGLIYVDYKTGKRTLKDSAFEYKKIIETNGENL